MEPESSVVNAASSSSDPDPKSSQLALSLLKSATKLRVFMLGLKKLKSPPSDPNIISSPKQNQNNNNNFFIKFKVEEIPIFSLFTREKRSTPPTELRPFPWNSWPPIEGLRFPWNSWPPSRPDANDLVIPLSALYTPLLPLADLPLLNYDPLLCSDCRSVLSPYARIEYRSALWICSFCHRRNSFPKSYAGIGDHNLPAEQPSFAASSFARAPTTPSPELRPFEVQNAAALKIKKKKRENPDVTCEARESGESGSSGLQRAFSG